jgi:predicted Na+-dependent transporter
MILFSKKFAEAVNSRFERLMPVLTPLGVVLGFLLPGVFIHLRPLVPFLFGLMTLSGALRLRAAEFGDTIRGPLPIVAFFASSHVLMPLAALLAASLFFGDSPDTVAGFILLFSGPAAVSAFIWVTIFKGDKALCLTLILLDTLLAPLVVPGTVSLLMGTKAVIDAGGIAVSLFLMVVLPTVIGVALNETSRGRIPDAVCPYLNPVSKICLMLVIAANTSPVGKMIRFDDPRVWSVAAVCVFLSAAGFVSSKLTASVFRCGTEKTAAVFFCGGLRNISAVTTIAVTFFPEAAALPALLGIVFQQTVSVVMGRLLLGKKEDEDIIR